MTVSSMADRGLIPPRSSARGARWSARRRSAAAAGVRLSSSTARRPAVVDGQHPGEAHWWQRRSTGGKGVGSPARPVVGAGMLPPRSQSAERAEASWRWVGRRAVKEVARIDGGRAVAHQALVGSDATAHRVAQIADGRAGWSGPCLLRRSDPVQVRCRQPGARLLPHPEAEDEAPREPHARAHVEPRRGFAVGRVALATTIRRWLFDGAESVGSFGGWCADRPRARRRSGFVEPGTLHGLEPVARWQREGP